MGGPESNESYFEGREVSPALVDLYFSRLGDCDRILDLGCGRGSFGDTERDVSVVGVDIDRGSLATAKEREDVALADLDSETLPFQSGSFDGVIAKDILEHLSNPGPVVGELSRVLEPGGRGVVSVPMEKPRAVWGDYTHVRGFTEDALRTMLEDYGFVVTSVTPMGGIPGAGRLGLTYLLPALLQISGLRRFSISHEAVLKKPVA